MALRRIKARSLGRLELLQWLNEFLEDDYSKIPIKEGEYTYTDLDEYLDKHFASIVGALIYISITARPDLAFAIGKLSRGMHKPNPRHLAMMKHTLGYLRTTQNYKMVYKKTGNNVETLFRELGSGDIALATLAGSDGQNIDPLAGFSDANLANKSGNGNNKHQYAIASDTGAIFYDADGNWTGGGVQIGTIGTQTDSLTAANFTVA